MPLLTDALAVSTPINSKQEESSASPSVSIDSSETPPPIGVDLGNNKLLVNTPSPNNLASSTPDDSEQELANATLSMPIDSYEVPKSPVGVDFANEPPIKMSPGDALASSTHEPLSTCLSAPVDSPGTFQSVNIDPVNNNPSPIAQFWKIADEALLAYDALQSQFLQPPLELVSEEENLMEPQEHSYMETEPIEPIESEAMNATVKPPYLFLLLATNCLAVLTSQSPGINYGECFVRSLSGRHVEIFLRHYRYQECPCVEAVGRHGRNRLSSRRTCSEI